MKLEPVRCACGWHGELATHAICPKCRKGRSERLTNGRLAALRTIDAGRQPSLAPMMRRWLVDRKLIEATRDEKGRLVCVLTGRGAKLIAVPLAPSGGTGGAA